MPYIRRFIPYLVVIAVAIPLVVFIISVYQSNESRFFEGEQEQLEITYTEVLDTYGLAFQMIYNEVLNQPDVLSLYSRAYGANEVEQAEIRQQLFNTLLPVYNRLQEMNLRQLHFHLPNNVSFLRFHRPEKYGDDLTGIRESVDRANQQQTLVTGFEEGRIFNGFRYVHPLTYQGEHIGTVETSVSFSALRTQMVQHFDGDVVFILNSETIGEKVFEEEQGNYIPSEISDTYYYDTATLEGYPLDESDAFGLPALQAVNAGLSDNALAQLQQGEAFSTYVRREGIDYAVTFLPIENLLGEQVAYIVGYRPGDFVRTNNQNMLLTLAVTVGGMLILGAFIYYRDRSSRVIEAQNENLKQVNVELAEAKDRAEAADRMKSRFLGNMSHELRTPLNAIINFTELVAIGASGEVNQEQEEHLYNSIESAEHLLSMINDLMDVTKIESGEMDLFMETVELEPLVQSAVKMARGLVKDKPVTIKVQIQPDLPPITGDRRRIKQILINLLSNAAKFTHEGEITISVCQKDGDIKISVADTGIGIAPEEAHMVFERFQQTSTGKEAKGSGLGMPISRFFAEAHGGRLWFDSTLNQGSTFYVTLPAKAEEKQFAVQV